MPVRGLVRTKIWFGFKIGAVNIKSLLKWSKGEAKIAIFCCINFVKCVFDVVYLKNRKYFVETKILAEF